MHKPRRMLTADGLLIDREWGVSGLRTLSLNRREPSKHLARWDMGVPEGLLVSCRRARCEEGAPDLRRCGTGGQTI